MEKRTWVKCIDCGKEFWNKRKIKCCKDCLAKKIRKRGSSSSVKRMIRNREFIKEYKKDKKCEICGYHKYPEILMFHHKDRKTKSAGVNTLMKTLKSLDIIKKEIEKCMILCPNCHNEIHLNEKYKSYKNEI